MAEVNDEMSCPRLFSELRTPVTLSMRDRSEIETGARWLEFERLTSYCNRQHAP